VTEQILFEKFNEVGPVLSIRICRDVITRASLGYAYVNFQNSVDAERALDTMNFEFIKDRPCRIMWCQRDPSLRRDNKGNIFIKNLPPTIDNKNLHDTFSQFGDILSCKVEYDNQGKSRGFGYVHFKTEQSAEEAISKVNNMVLQIEGVTAEDQKPLFVGHFKSRTLRAEADPDRKFTNLYVRGFPASYTLEQLNALFTPYGTVKSSVIITAKKRSETDENKVFGFVDFESPEHAVTAKDALNATDIAEGVKLLVTRAQKKKERALLLRQKLETSRTQRRIETRPFNLYVKHLDLSYTDEAFKNLFDEFGTISSSKVMRVKETGESKGFGFVCFSSQEEATNALTNMNGKMVGRKPLYVSFAQSREERRRFLEGEHRNNIYRMPMGQYPPAPYAPQYFQQLRMMPGGYVGPGSIPRRFPYAMPNTPAYRPNLMRPQMPRQAVQGQYRPQLGGGMLQSKRSTAPAYPNAAPLNAAPRAPSAKSRQPDLLEQLNNSDPNQQRQLLGGLLYTRIQVSEDITEDKRRKITGMLLDMGQSEVIHLLEDDGALQQQVSEANLILDTQQGLAQ